jgi:hypothetical protein
MSKAGDAIENPVTVQKVHFAVLAPGVRLLGYRGTYPEYVNRRPSEVVEVEPSQMPEQENDSSARV